MWCITGIPFASSLDQVFLAVSWISPFLRIFLLILVSCIIWKWSVSQFSCSVVSNLYYPMDCSMPGLPPCPSPTPGACSSSCPSSWWCHPTISSSVILFSSCLQSFPASGSFPTSQLFTSSGQSTGTSASASVLPMSSQDWFALGWTGWISL